MILRHRQREDTAPFQCARRRDRRRLELLLLEVDSQPLELEREILARPGRVVRDETQPVARLAQLLDRVRRPRDRFPRDLKDALDVQQNGRHGRRVYSGHALGEHPPVGDRAALLALERTGRPARPEDRVAGGSGVRREASSALTERQKSRVLTRAGPVLRAVAQDERSQWRNRELATERLVEQLRAALRVERPRRATKPTRASQERRLEQKRRRGEIKRLRRDP